MHIVFRPLDIFRLLKVIGGPLSFSLPRRYSSKALQPSFACPDMLRKHNAQFVIKIKQNITNVIYGKLLFYFIILLPGGAYWEDTTNKYMIVFTLTKFI